MATERRNNSSASLARQADTDIGFDPRFERRWCIFERVVWGVFVLAIVVGLLGLLGRGPLNKKVAQGQDGTTVKYERVVRYHTPTAIEVQAPAHNGFALIVLDKKALEKLGLKEMIPLPSRSMASGQVGPFLFAVTSPAANSVLVKFSLEPASIGPISSTVQVNGKTDTTLDQVMVP
jgi:hypothetical protein